MSEAPTRTQAPRMTEARALSAQLEELEAALRERGPGPELDVALAECRFRLAVHPDTLPGEALRHLAEALRLDAVNPKYPYHIARIYWLAGDLERAGEWLEGAFRACPTSHRLWSHMSRLQFEMALAYAGISPHALDELRSRGKSIASAILAGTDTLEDAVFTLDVSAADTDNRSVDSGGKARCPADTENAGDPAGAEATEAVPRITNAGRCRWPGVAEVLVWEALAKKPTKQSLEGVMPIFERIAAGHASRPDGTPRFAQLAIEWLVCGYPPDTVRRLREGVRGPSPALDLLDLVLDLYEMPTSDVPSAMARELTVGGSGALPPLLGAVIHDRRILWKRPVFEGYSAYRRARRLLQRDRAEPSKEQLEEAARHTFALSKAVDRLVPKPPKRVADFRLATRESAEGSADSEAELRELEGAAERLGEIRVQMMADVKRIEAAASDLEDSEAYAAVRADRAAVEDLLGAFALASTAGTERLERVIASIGAMDDEGAADAGERSRYTQEIERRKVACQAGFTELTKSGGARLRFKRIDMRLQDAFHRFPESDDAEPSPNLRRMLAEVRAFVPTAERTERDQEPAFEAYDGGGRTGMDALEHVLSTLDDRIEKLFGELYDSFIPYETVIDRLPAMSMLRRSVRSAHAEMLHRMGRRSETRRLWQHSLREDRVNPGILHNVAVCDTYSRNLGRSLSSWQAYAEVLYYLDVVSGDPSMHAAGRAELHRSLAGAYGPSIEMDERNNVEADVEEVASLLSNPARLRHFVDHYLLFALNEKLNRQSPYLVLGVKSSDSEETMEKARDRLTGFVKSLAPLFPERVRDAFTDTCVRRFEQALAVCVPRADMPAPPRPSEQELEAETDFLVSVIKQKYSLRAVLIRDGAIERAEGATYAFQIPRLDEIPLDLSEQIGEKAAGQLGAHLQVFRDMFGDLLEGVIVKTFKSDIGRNPPVYRELISACRRNPSMERVAELIDRPQFAYPEEVVGALKDENVPREPAIKWLLAFARRFPSSTDPAVFASQFMRAEGYPFERVIEVLSTAIANGFWNAGVCRCRALRMQFAFEQGADAWTKRKDKDALSKAWRLASEDAEYVKSHSEEEDELEIAETILQRLEEVHGW